MKPSPLLKTRKLVKSFKHPLPLTILNGVDLEVYPGDVIAIGGRSGEGKSTLLHLLGALDVPSSGNLEILGTPATWFNRSSLRCNHIGFIFQAFYLLADYTALENVLMAGRIARKSISPGSLCYNHAVHLLERVGLKNRMHHSTKLLSGGEKQRVAIARALCNNPSIILADEPTGNLDRQTAEEIYQILLETVEESQKALVIVTHDPLLIAKCKQRFTLSQGILK